MVQKNTSNLYLVNKPDKNIFDNSKPTTNHLLNY
jgi:hypothetical protein